jgi:hypothetical protein
MKGVVCMVASRRFSCTFFVQKGWGYFKTRSTLERNSITYSTPYIVTNRGVPRGWGQQTALNSTKDRQNEMLCYIGIM